MPIPPADYVIRPMAPADVPVVERLTDAAFFDLDGADPARRMPSSRPTARRPAAAAWRARVEHLLRHDPRGCWVAEDEAGVLGVAVSLKRELTWVLATFAVRPGVQGRGVGRQLLDAALAYGSGCLRAMVAASDDPRRACAATGSPASRCTRRWR